MDGGNKDACLIEETRGRYVEKQGMESVMFPSTGLRVIP